MRKQQVAGIAVVASLALAGCSQASERDAAIKIEAPTPQLQQFYDQRVNWQSCKSDKDTLKVTENRARARYFSCATVSVPLNYADPKGESISLEMVKYSQSREGKPLVYNPGGPGGSAISSLPSMIDSIFSEDLLDYYDIVAVDPRGVGLSTPVRCLTDAEIDDARAHPGPTTIDGIKEESTKIGNKCMQKSPDMTQYSDSESAARDLDIVRAALGLKQLDYFGFSYGTFLGALYADEFPGNVGHFVLDGAMDPAASADDVSEAQARGFEDAAGNWIKSSKALGDMPLSGSVDEIKEQIRSWLNTLDEAPVPTSDPKRPLTKALATSALISLLYDSQTYSIASMGLRQAMQQKDGSVLLQVADLYQDRQKDGTYLTNSFDAFNVINALDYPVDGDPAQWQQRADTLRADLPLFGEEFGLASAVVAGWPVKSKDTRKNVKAKGAAPILVVGTTHDPATPYPWAQKLAEQLESGHLLSAEGWRHCAYSQEASDCVVNAVDDFLIDGTLPKEGLVCAEND